MGIERVGLEHHGDVAVLRMQLVDAIAGNADLAAGNVLEASNHAQQGGLAAARRADKHDELAVLDPEVDVMQHFDGAIGLLDVLDIDRCHFD